MTVADESAAPAVETTQPTGGGEPVTTQGDAPTNLVQKETPLTTPSRSSAGSAAPAPKGQPGKDGLPADGPDSNSPDPVVADPPRPQTFKVKIDGKEIELSEAQLRENVQLSMKSRQAMNEAAEMRKAATETFNLMGEKPIEALLFGLTRAYGSEDKAWQKCVEIADQVIEREIKYRQMPEEQRELLKVRAENEKLRKTQETYKEREDRQAFEAAKADYEKQALKEIGEAIKTNGLAPNEENIKAIAQRVVLGEDGEYAVSPSEAASALKKELDEYRERNVLSLSPDEIMTRYPDFMKKLNEANLQKVKEQKSGRTAPKASPREEGALTGPPKKEALPSYRF